MKKHFKFKLKEKTLVIIDWANVYGWFEKLKWKIDLKRLFKYLKGYSQIKDIRFYFGVEKGNKKSEEFQKEIKKGDYKAIAEYLLDRKKQVIVIHPFGLRGKEYNELLLRKINKPYLCAVEKLKSFLKKSTR